MYVESGYNLRITDPIKKVLKKTKVGWWENIQIRDMQKA